MAQADSFYKQHEELVEVVGKISGKLNAATIVAQAGEVRGLLNTLLGKLSIHLSMEDKALYPRLQQHADAKIRDTAKKFAAEMANVAPVVQAFGAKWNESEIKANPAAFVEETKKLFAALADRIRRENTELYPLLDKAG